MEKAPADPLHAQAVLRFAAPREPWSGPVLFLGPPPAPSPSFHAPGRGDVSELASAAVSCATWLLAEATAAYEGGGEATPGSLSLGTASALSGAALAWAAATAAEGRGLGSAAGELAALLSCAVAADAALAERAPQPLSSDPERPVRLRCLALAAERGAAAAGGAGGERAGAARVAPGLWRRAVAALLSGVDAAEGRAEVVQGGVGLGARAFEEVLRSAVE